MQQKKVNNLEFEVFETILYNVPNEFFADRTEKTIMNILNILRNKNLKEYKIVGVTDLSSPSIYAYPSEFLTLISNSSNGNDYDYNGPIDIMDYNLYKDKIFGSFYKKEHTDDK